MNAPAYPSSLIKRCRATQAEALRDLVETAIEQHLPPHQFKVLKEAEASERRLIHGLVNMALSQGGAS